jgi:hypothetical protein
VRDALTDGDDLADQAQAQAQEQEGKGVLDRLDKLAPEDGHFWPRRRGAAAAVRRAQEAVRAQARWVSLTQVVPEGCRCSGPAADLPSCGRRGSQLPDQAYV